MGFVAYFLLNEEMGKNGPVDPGQMYIQARMPDRKTYSIATGDFWREEWWYLAQGIHTYSPLFWLEEHI